MAGRALLYPGKLLDARQANDFHAVAWLFGAGAGGSPTPLVGPQTSKPYALPPACAERETEKRKTDGRRVEYRERKREERKRGERGENERHVRM